MNRILGSVVLISAISGATFVDLRPAECSFAIEVRFESVSDDSPFELVDPNDPRIPQLLLPVMHCEETQAELQLSASEVEWLAETFREIDGDWWRARILPEAEQRNVTHRVERKLWDRLVGRFQADRLRRIEQLVMQAQHTRVLLRHDIAKTLGLSVEQRKQIDRIVGATEALKIKLTQAQDATESEQLRSEIQAKSQSEPRELLGVLDARQKAKLTEILGKEVNLTQARRIFPQAPEFAPGSQWIGEPLGRMADLRGKVVVIHFYAFQCINCRRNFHHYNEWADRWAGKDVVVVGIQTPETAAERDQQKVQQAADEDGFRFPVIMDAKQENWNAWANTMWPTVYIVDKNGYIRMWWQGELNWQGATGDQNITELVEQLLK